MMNKDKESREERNEKSLMDLLSERLEDSLKDSEYSYSEDGRRVIIICAAAAVLEQSCNYYQVLEKRMCGIDVDAVAKDFYLPKEICEKIKASRDYNKFVPKSNRYEKKQKLSVFEKEMIDIIFGQAVIKFVLFELLQLTKEDALTRIRNDETRFLAQTRLNKDFERIFKHADAETLWKCKYRKADVVFYTLFPEWYEKTQDEFKCKDIIMAKGNTKSGMKLLGAGPELSEELVNEKDFDAFAAKFIHEIEEKVLSREWYSEKVDYGFMKTLESFFHSKQERITLADRKNDIDFLLNVQKAIVKKGEYPGLFEVMEKRGYDHIADAYYLNMPQKQMFALAEWYETRRTEAGLKANEALNFAFQLNRYLKEEEGVFMEDIETSEI